MCGRQMLYPWASTHPQLLIAQCFYSMWNVLVFPEESSGWQGKFKVTVWGYVRHHRPCQFSKKEHLQLRPLWTTPSPYVFAVRCLSFIFPLALWCGHDSSWLRFASAWILRRLNILHGFCCWLCKRYFPLCMNAKALCPCSHEVVCLPRVFSCDDNESFVRTTHFQIFPFIPGSALLFLSRIC